MADYLSLEEAAQKLGIPTEKLVDMRSQGEIRGFRDGASWKFPENEIDRLADELGASGADSGFGSGLLISENEVGSAISQGGSSIIGGDDSKLGQGESDLDLASSDLGIGGAVPKSTTDGSDVNLVADLGDGSDVSLVPSSSGLSDSSGKGTATPPLAGEDDFAIDDDDGLQEIDSKILQIDEPALLHDSSDEIDLSLEVKDGSTGPVIAAKKSSVPMADSSGSLDLGAEPEDMAKGDAGDLSFTGVVPDDDSGELVLGDDDSSMDALASDVLSDSNASRSGASSLELMDELNGPLSGSGMASASGIHSSGDVLSELDLLSAESGGSGLISGDSANLLVSSGLGSSLGDDVLGGLDDALDDDDDLVIADDDDDLVIDSSGVDISVAGDSGINLMSPSDSGLSLESEPLDLAGSSISALDLGAELADGSDVGEAGSDASGSMVDFQADEEFQLSPSGIGLEADFESGSQVIEVEDSEAIGEAVEFDDAEAPVGDAFATDDAGGFGDEAEAMDAEAVDEDAPVGLDTTSARRSSAIAAAGGVGTYEVPFNLLQCLALLSIIAVMSLGGMLMTDLIRNMWTYTEPSAPVSSLTDALISLMGWS
ncbi:helix-turn-helix domain-containing protein [Planctomycetes bacterium K23_9]|uniref:Helix-turn-helix domain protein n=1 Tax=Stieleria marina TaxID=1930275 RepID=A0A517NPA2_9BACT|nr:Helix-turn-helix domain protein [Planctomycetes bacterium K23_9]